MARMLSNPHPHNLSALIKSKTPSLQHIIDICPFSLESRGKYADAVNQAKEEVDIAELRCLAQELISLLAPIYPKKLALLLYRLRLHYPIAKQCSKQDIAYLMEDYMEDLREYPDFALVEACKAYRSDKDSLYFPKIGQLRALLSSDYYRAKTYLRRVEMLRKALGDTAPLPDPVPQEEPTTPILHHEAEEPEPWYEDASAVVLHRKRTCH